MSRLKSLQRVVLWQMSPDVDNLGQNSVFLFIILREHAQNVLCSLW